MHQSVFRVPSHLWDLTDKKDHVMALMLDNGRILTSIYVNKRGEIIGRVVGGQDGLVELDPKEIEGMTIVAVRYIDNFWGSLGLTRWIKSKS